MPRQLILIMAAMSAPALSADGFAQSLTQNGAMELVHQVIEFHRSKVGHDGAYLWKYSADLKHQEGEGKATATSGWTQPPGTPFVGEAYLKAWRLTGDKACLDAAVEAARALVTAQLESGGWASHFDLAQPGRGSYRYRIDGAKGGRRNSTTFDDNKSQSALSLLMHVDEALQFEDHQIHAAVEYALSRMLPAQYPNGAWPQQYSEPLDPSNFPVVRASYPPAWPREFPKQKYVGFYTLNDNNMAYIVDMLFEAHRIYDRRDCFDAAVRTGDFFLLAQMPEPQPGWAQQYNTEMHPVWARKFEPAAITGGESQSVMKTLLRLYRFTGDRKFIAPIPRAIAYYRKSTLSTGQLARFYELKTNTPLYFTKDYQLTYDDDDMPTHYSFKVSSKLDSLEREYRKLESAAQATRKPIHEHVKAVRRSTKLAKAAATAARNLDERGAWIEQGEMEHQENRLMIIDMRTFAKNVEILAAFAGSTK